MTVIEATTRTSRTPDVRTYLIEENLTDTERDRFADLEAEVERTKADVERGLEAFVEMGVALFEIRDTKLYRESHSTWEGYCRDRWQIGRNYANKLIAAAEIVDVLRKAGAPEPTNEVQARALKPLLKRPELLPAVMEEASADGDPTATKIRAAVKVRTTTTKTAPATKPKPTPRNAIRVIDLDNAADLLNDPLLASLPRLEIGKVSIKANGRTKELDRSTPEEIRAYVADERTAVEQLRQEADRREHDANALSEWETKVRPLFAAKKRATRKTAERKAKR